MGSLPGHALPAVFFGIFSFWWCYSVFRDYFRSKLRNGPKFCNRPWYPVPCCKREYPVESVIKLTTVAIGMCGEFVTALNEKGEFVQIGNAQHMTMYFFFGLNGIADLLIYYNVIFLDGLEYVTIFLAYAVEGILFYFHLHGRSHMDVQLHMFLFYVIVACAVSVILEMYHRNSVIPSLCFVYFNLVQASWFLQVGFVLYPPTGMKQWDEEDHQQMMIITLAFTWHLAVDLVVVMLVGFVVMLRVKRGKHFSVNDTEYQKIDHRSMTSLKSSYNDGIPSCTENGHKDQRLLDSDSETI